MWKRTVLSADREKDEEAWFRLEDMAQVALTSEDIAHPVEERLELGRRMPPIKSELFPTIGKADSYAAPEQRNGAS
jgi:hypothetical protein